MDYSEKWGVDVEEAVKLALADLKLSRDEVEVTVLEEPSKGFFGIGSKLAKVRVEKKKPEEKPEETVVKKEPAEKKENKSEEKKSAPKSGERKQKKNRERKNREKKESFAESGINIDPVNMDELVDAEDHEALTFLKDVTEKMGLSLDFKLKTGNDVVYIEMN